MYNKIYSAPITTDLDTYNYTRTAACLHNVHGLCSADVKQNTDESDTSGEEELHEYQWDTNTLGDNCNVEVEDEFELSQDDSHSPNISHEYDIEQTSTQKTVTDGTIAGTPCEFCLSSIPVCNSKKITTLNS